MNDYSQHKWSFSTIGGVKRVNLDTGEDLLALEYLDQKLWTALSCPVEGLEIDAKTLALLDTDQDGKIRVPEIIAAVKWTLAHLKNANDLLNQSDTFPLSALNNTEQGNYLLRCAQIVLSTLGKQEATALTLHDVSDLNAAFSATPFNGDGVITADASKDELLAALITDISGLYPGVTDRSGKPGINLETTEKFYADMVAYRDWQQQAKDNAANILPLGDDTANAFACYEKVHQKIEDYFLRCKLAAYDSDSTPVLNQVSARVEAITQNDLSGSLDAIGEYPLSKVNAQAELSLNTGINPAWETAMLQFKLAVSDKLLTNTQTLSLANWQKIKDTFAPYQAWLASGAGQQIAMLSQDKIGFAQEPSTREALVQLIHQDLDMADEAEAMSQVEKLVRFYKDLYKLLRNFVTFFDFYSPGQKAIFQAGTLYIDQRSCDLCIRVNDMGRHNAMVSYSGMFLLYCDCESKATGEKLTIVAALTNGDVDNLIEGRKAVFYDRKGNDYDATIIKIVENPISIRQAFFTPYRRVSRFVSTQVKKFAQDQDSKVEQQSAAGVGNAATGLQEKAAQANAPQTVKVVSAEPAQPFDIGKFVGIFAAIGLAVGAIGTALASLIGGIMALAWWKIPLAFAGLMLLISGPSMLIAWLKLRKRNLAPILDANGWAINAKVTVNIAFGNLLTHLAQLPLGSKVNLNDPFRKKGMPLWQSLFLIMVILVSIFYLLIHFGLIQQPW